MFLKNFVSETIARMINSHSVPDYQIMVFALGWLNKSVLTEEDLQKIQLLIQEEFKQPEPDTPVEGTLTEN